MTIHQKINAKGNFCLAADGNSLFWRSMPFKIMNVRYDNSKMPFIQNRIAYAQDRKTNYREPNVPDYNAPTQAEISERLHKCQRELK